MGACIPTTKYRWIALIAQVSSEVERLRKNGGFAKKAALSG
jgi:hypothetical protein